MGRGEKNEGNFCSGGAGGIRSEVIWRVWRGKLGGSRCDGADDGGGVSCKELEQYQGGEACREEKA